MAAATLASLLAADEEQPRRRRRPTVMGEVLKTATSSEPISSPAVGWAKMAAAAIAGLSERSADQKDATDRRMLADAVLAMRGGGGAVPATSPTNSAAAGTSAGATTAMSMGATAGERADERPDVAQLKTALGPMESGNRYDIKGPHNAKYGFPLGKFQIMESNLPEWSMAALGRRVTSEEFLGSPELQEKIAGHRMGLILDKHGNLQDAASVWHSGRPLAQAKAAGARDVNMSTADYVARTVGNKRAEALPDPATLLGPQAAYASLDPMGGSGDGGSALDGAAPLPILPATRAAVAGSPTPDAAVGAALDSLVPQDAGFDPMGNPTGVPLPAITATAPQTPDAAVGAALDAIAPEGSGFDPMGNPTGVPLPQAGPAVPATPAAEAVMPPSMAAPGVPAPMLPEPARPAPVVQAAPVAPAVAPPPLPPARPADLPAPAADLPAPGAQEVALRPPAAPPGDNWANMENAGAGEFARSGMGMPAMLAEAVRSGGGPATTGSVAPAGPVAGGAPAPAASPAAIAGPAAAPAGGGGILASLFGGGQPAQPAGPMSRDAALRHILQSPNATSAHITYALSQLDGGKTERVDLGDAIGVLDQRGNVVARIPKSKMSTYGVIGKDQYGNEQYGFIDTANARVTPGPQAAPPAPGESAVPPVPPGVDPKVWREQHSKQVTADALPVDPKAVSEVRREVLSLPSYKNIRQAAPVYRSMLDTAGTDSKASDLNLIYGLGKIMDPGSVVREGELALANGTAGLDQRLAGFANSVFGGSRLTPQTRAALLAEAHSRMKSYKAEYDGDANHYRGIAKRGRMTEEDVVPRFEPFTPWTPPPKAAGPGAAPDPKVVADELRKRGLIK